jgi:Spy/CpxP family protein refolding chaperone
MKKLVLALGLALASGLAMAAPEAPKATPPDASPGGPHVARSDDLGLTDEQRQEMRKIREAGGGREEIEAVYTPEQREKLRQMKESYRSSNGRDNLDVMKQELDLSDEQVAQMKKIRDEGGHRREMYKVLTPEQMDKFRQSRQRSQHPKRPPPPGSAPAGESTPG